MRISVILAHILDLPRKFEAPHMMLERGSDAPYFLSDYSNGHACFFCTYCTTQYNDESHCLGKILLVVLLFIH